MSIAALEHSGVACRLSVIIVNWNSKAFLEACLSTLLPQLPDASEVIVIDNASFDGADAMVRAKFPSVIWIQSDRNTGFAAANNRAAEAATGEWLLFLNPDTELTPGSLISLLKAGERLSDAGVIGAKLLNTDGSVQMECVKAFPTLTTELADAAILKTAFPTASLWGMRVLYDHVTDPGVVDVVSGACQLVRRSRFRQVDGYSEEYFMYSEDVDLCYRMRAEGYVNYLVRNSLIIHHGGGSSSIAVKSFAAQMMRESRAQFFTAHRGATYARVYRTSTGLASAVRLLILLAMGPTIALGGRRREWHQSIGKWWAVLSWACGQRASDRPARR